MEAPSSNESGPAAVSALVLCGGGGTRMGGVDKGLVTLAGRRLVDHVVQRLAPQVGNRIVLSCNRHVATYQALGYPCVSDRPEHAGTGPLAGIAAGLERVRTRYCLVCPCDTPLLPQDLAGRLLTALQEQGGSRAVVHDGTRMQPLHCLLETAQGPALRQLLHKGAIAVQAWIAAAPTVEVDFSDQADAFCNLNTPADVLAGEDMLRESHRCNR